MKYLIAGSLVMFSLAGCAPLSPQAAGVMMYSQASTLIDSCKKLGPVSVKAKMGGEIGVQQAKNDLRQVAFDKYNADSVVVLNVDMNLFAAPTVTGMALKCGTGKVAKNY